MFIEWLSLYLALAGPSMVVMVVDNVWLREIFPLKSSIAVDKFFTVIVVAFCRTHIVHCFLSQAKQI